MIPGDLTTAQAQQVLTNSAHTDAALVRAALQLLAGPADYKMLGVCADSLDEGYAALTGYLAAFDYPVPPLDRAPVAGPGVFIKYNAKTGTCYSSAYSGPERGVIVSCYSPTSSAGNDTYANLPLDLYR